MLRGMRVVFWKEIRDATRDRRSLASGLLYAVWGPLVMMLALVALARDRAPEQRLDLLVEGRERAPALMAFLAARDVELLDAAEDVAQAVRARRRAVALVVEPAYGERFLAARPAPLTLVHDGSWARSNAAAARVRALLEEHAAAAGQARLILRGVTPDALRPLRVRTRDVSTAARRAANLLAMLPIFLLMAAFIGGMNVAADATAGERERGSLEALLLHPVPRLGLTLGKWAAASLLSAATCVATLLVAQATLRHPRVRAVDLPLGLSASDVLWILGLLLPLALAAPAAQMFVALFARSYKEAHTQLSLLLFLPAVPGFLLAFGSLPETAWLRAVPVVGHQLLVTDVLAGAPPAWSAAALLAGTSVLLAAAAVAATARLLGHERIVAGARA